MLASNLMMWQNQYNLTHLMIPKSTPVLLLDLEAIKQVIVEKQNERLKGKGKDSAACPDTKSNPNRIASGGSGDQVPKKVCSEKFFQHCKSHGGPYQMHNTSDCRCYNKDSKPLGAAAGEPSKSKTIYKFWGDKSMAFMQTISTLMQKPGELVSLRSVTSMSMTLVAVPIVNRKLGVTTLF